MALARGAGRSDHQGMAGLLAYVAGPVVAGWAVAHAVPTRRVLGSDRLKAGKHAVVWFKICPVLLASSAGLLLAASLL